MFFSFLVFILFSTNVQIDAKNSANDECLTETYCISSDGSGVCSENNLVTAQLKTVPNPGEADSLELTLKGYNINPNDEKKIKVSFDRTNRPSNSYTCYKSSLGSTYAKFETLLIGGYFGLKTWTSNYTDGVLYCIYFLRLKDAIWPQADVDMMKNDSKSITLYNDKQKVIFPQLTSDLPIYRKSSNKVHGNGIFQLTFTQTEDEILYRFNYLEDNNSSAQITLTSKKGIVLQFVCFDTYPGLFGLLTHVKQSVSIDVQLRNPYVVFDKSCSWSTPFMLGNQQVLIDVSTSIFDLDVKIGGDLVYIEKNVTLKDN